jgi:hypothetical protein
VGVIVSDHLKFCTERGRLVNLLSIATSQYAKAANELSLAMGTLSEPEYRLRRSNIEQARLDAEQARLALLQHRREHGC